MSNKKNKKSVNEANNPHQNAMTTASGTVIQNESKIVRILRQIFSVKIISLAITVATFLFFMYDRFHKVPEEELMLQNVRDNIEIIRGQIKSNEYKPSIDTLAEVSLIKEYQNKVLIMTTLIEDMYLKRNNVKPKERYEYEQFVTSQGQMHSDVLTSIQDACTLIGILVKDYSNEDYKTLNIPVMNNVNYIVYKCGEYMKHEQKLALNYAQNDQLDKMYQTLEALPYSKEYTVLINAFFDHIENFNIIIHKRLIKIEGEQYLISNTTPADTVSL